MTIAGQIGRSEANRACCFQAIASVAAAGASLVMLPASIVPGDAVDPQALQAAAPVDGRSLRLWSDLARAHGILGGDIH
ncbi:hypothetical protein MMB17_04645 [Methylobacterium organophilum]|uniref:hypothetical protein n=1 Tax=Methylobacterium organophilum TaxID=410 RepID=UPI001F141B0E|nr:hypothetical protein [Methylobacterium organophilum]UMY18624.1 hypothetical protein MMB17_04645 [Methylobacterium organophilum]